MGLTCIFFARCLLSRQDNLGTKTEEKHYKLS